MTHPHRSTKIRLAAGTALAVVLFLLVGIPAQVRGSDGVSRALLAAHTQLTRLDSYAFTARVTQTTHPLPALANVGLSSQTSSLLVQGQVDQRAGQIELSIIEQSGHLLDGLRQIDLRLRDGQVWGRAPGQDWEAMDHSQVPDPASSDPAAFLQATRNARSARVEERLGQVYQVVTFELDGRAWAEIMRQELQSEMRRRGELAPGEMLERLEYYEKMTGAGELWLDAAGLPQRLTLHTVYPPLPGESEYREVETVTDYRDFGAGTRLARLGADFASALGLATPLDPPDPQQPRAISRAASTATAAPLLTLFLLLPVALLRFRRSPRLYRLIVLVIVGIFAAEPVLNASVVQAASVRRDDRLVSLQSNSEEEAQIEAAVAQIRADFASSFDVTQGRAAQVETENAQSRAADKAGDVAPAGSAAEAKTIFLGFRAVTVPMRDYLAGIDETVDTDGDGLSDLFERTIGASSTAADTDGDGIDDATELLLGLDPADPDTDGDLLSDGFEVAGIELGGKTWYLDPLNNDTTGDGSADTLECAQAINILVSPSGKKTKVAPRGDGLCADTDGDGAPDFADDDNDNDGVRDWMDGQPDSRFGDLAAGVPNQIFAYGVDNYSAGRPLRITLEVRPTDAQHLWYSMNVLDWPGGDYQGQIRRVHNTTLGTTGAAANGDMQLVPMIEITLPGDEAIHLPTRPGKAPIVGDNSRLAEWLDMPVLERYQMAVSWMPDKQSLQVFLPATLIRDRYGNAPANFVAKMLYWPNGTGLFSKNHAARLVWLVQMDVDNCIVPANSNFQDSCLPEGKNYQNGIHWQTTRGQMVHRYYDDFYVTAFTAEEDLTANAQVFYEDPAQIANPAAYVPDQLLGLGTVLESYLRQRQTPAEALATFKAKNPAMGSRLAAGNLLQDPDTYGLMAKIVTEEAPRVLNTVFAPHRQQMPYPAMLYVTWGESRMTGLQGIPGGESLRLNLSNGAVKSATNIRLGSFVYNPNPASVGGRQNPNWDPADPGRIWLNYLQGQSAAAYAQLPQAAQGRFNAEQFQQATLGVFWNLARGVNLVNNLAKPLADDLSDVQGLVDEIGAAFDNAGENAIGALMGVFDDFKDAQENLGQAARQQTAVKKSLLSLVGKDVKNAANLKGALKTAKIARGLGLASVTFAGASATVSVVLSLKDQLGLSEGAVVALEAVNATMGAVLAGLQLTQEITKVIQAVQSASDATMKALKSALAFQNTMSAAGVIAAVVVAALILVTAFVMYFKLLGDGDAVAARTALAQGVATTIVVLLLFVISALFPIGTAIALLIGLLDGVIAAICKIANWVGGEDDEGQNFEARNSWLCNGVVGNLTAAFAGLFYKSVPMVDMAYKNRLQFGQTDTKLIPVGNLTGMNAGNLMQVTQPVTMTVRLPDAHSLNQVGVLPPQPKPGFIGVDATGPMPLADYERLIKDKNIFNYELITDMEAAKNSDLAGRTTPAAWKSIGKANDRDRLFKVESPTIQITLSAGINWNPDLFVREYYRYSLAECGLFAGKCDYKLEHFDKFITNTQVITIGTNLIYDVFPNNLTGFRTLEQAQEDGQFVNKYRLAWGGKTPFPVLRDADGDGLAADIDPDDKTADADGDGLPDAVEVQDFRLNPLRADSDGDGLSDYDEMRRGVRPDRADTDGDGLTDNEEITGWELVYVDAAGAARRTWVRSDPLVADTSGDGLTDLQARVLGLNPRARYTDLSVLRIETSTNQAGSAFLAPSQSIAFTSTVSNDLRKPVAYGLLEAEILGSGQALAPIIFELQPQQSRAIRGSIQAPAAPVNNSEEIILRNRAGANMVDPGASYADQLRGLAQPGGLKFQLNFEQRPADERNFQDVTGNAALTCADGYCPSVVRSTDSYGTFRANGWYAAAGQNLAFSQPRFSLGGWVTVDRAFGGKYNERVILGPDNADGTDRRYLQLSVTDLQSSTPKARIHFTATDGAVCQQTLTELTVPTGQKTHVFVTYDGTLVHGYRNGQLVGSYNLQNCANKVPAGDRFTIGRGSTDATLYVHSIYFRSLDEGGGWLSGGEPYMQLDNTVTPFWRKDGVNNDQTHTVNAELLLRNATRADANSTVYICEEDRGDKQGQCRSDSSTDSDDFLGTVTLDPRRNGSYNTGWSSGEGAGTLSYNVQNNFFQGSLDDLRLYESLLSQQEVAQLVSGDGLQYQLDEASGRVQFRTAGVDPTQLTCAGGEGCPTSGVKGYAGQAVSFTGGASQALNIGRLRQRFGSNLVASFWFKPEAGSATAATPILRYGQGQEGFSLYATRQAGGTSLRAAFNYAATTLIGRPGGNSYTLSCNPGEALVGIIGGAGNVIDRVGPLCVTTTPDYANWTGDPVQRGSAGGSGGGGYIRTCPRDSYVTGFSGRAGVYVDSIQIECARPSSAGVLDSRNPTRLDGAGGSGGNVQPQQVCPSSLPAVGIYGMAGGLVDQFGLTCTGQPTAGGVNLPAGQWAHVSVAQNNENLLLYVNGQPAQNVWFGTSPRAEYRLTGNYATDFSLGSLGGAGLRGLVDELQIQAYSANVLRTALVGGFGPAPGSIPSLEFSLGCQLNEALVGIYGGAGGAVDRVGPLCAVINAAGQWVGAPVRRGTAGGSGGSEYERLCAVNSAIAGFQSRAGSFVDQLQPVCAPLAENGAIDRAAATTLLSAVGGSGGSAQTPVACPSGLPATGIFGRSFSFVDAFGLQCGALPHASIRQPFTDSALVHLAVDETTGSTTFANSTGRGNLACTDAASCPQAGLKGQVRESIQFNNSGTTPLSAAPRLNVPTNLTDRPFSFAAWVRIPGVPAGPSSVVALHTTESSEDVAWRLQLVNSGGRTVPQLTGQTSNGSVCSGSFTVIPADVNLAVNQWHHLGVNYDPTDGRNDITLYINGRKVHQERLTNLICRAGTTLRFGQSYRGQVDEFFFYAKSLSVNEFLSQFVYQSTWYDVVTTERFRVDYNPPTLKLTTGAFIKPGTTIFGVAVSDAESGIRAVEYRDTDGQWQPARTETATGGVWAFGLTIQSSGEVAVRATDNVGNVATDTRTVTVDGTAPAVALTSTARQTSLVATGTVADAGSGVQSFSAMFIDPFGNAFSLPRTVPVVNGGWTISQELPPTVNGRFQVWAAAVDQMGNQFQGIIGSVLVDNAAPAVTLEAPPPALSGLADAGAPSLPVIRGTVTDQPQGNSPNPEPGAVQRVEVALLHRADKDDPARLVWQEAALGGAGQISTTWQFQIPGDLEGIYDISLRATDAAGNQRTLPGVWTGVIDTRAPRIALAGGAVLGGQSCTVTDFSLRENGFVCGNVTGTSSAATALYAAGALAPAGLTWDARWYQDLFRGRAPADRLYAVHQAGVSFADPNRGAASCDIYGNCTACLLTSDDVASAGCLPYRAIGMVRSAADDDPGEDQALFDTGLTGPGTFTVTVLYERPDAYAPGAEPDQPTSEWVQLVESYTLVDDAVLASTRPFAGLFTEAATEIEWTESISATGYYAGWTADEIPNLDDLTFYAEPDIHSQSLPDRGRYFAHVVAVDDEDGATAFTLGPIYFDGAPPGSYLNWDESGPAQPSWFWEESLSATGQMCNLLGEDDRVSLFTGGASARSRQQTIFGTWNDEWLALHWNGLNLAVDGDLHLYLDTQAGGTLAAFDPYGPVADAASLVVMPERRQYKTDAVDRMLADFAVIVEDDQRARLLQWNGAAWTDLPTAQMRFTTIEGVVYIWLPLALLGVDPAAVDVSLVGFVTEEESMAIWAAMPGNNPLNSPAMLPGHQTAAVAVDRALVNLQTSMRLSADREVNNTLDNCPTNVLFEQSLLDIQFIADPAAEVYDPVVYDGLRGVVPQDVQDLLAGLCAGVSNPGEGTVCELAQQIADGYGGDGPPVGPTGQHHATAGPGDPLTFYATVRNLSSQATGYLTLEVEEADDLFAISGAVLDVGVLDAFESRVISFTEGVDPDADYDFTLVTIYPVEEVENVEDEIILTYFHEPHTVIHDIDRTAPTDAALSERLLVDLIGTGEQLLEGIVYDQSLVTAVTLQTSLGQTATCTDTLRQTAFTTGWACAITVPEDTPDGTLVTVSLAAQDAYGFASDVIAAWEFEVDNTAPQVNLTGEDGRGRSVLSAAVPTTQTLRLEGLAGDERLLGGVIVCDTLLGHESCTDATLAFFGDELTDVARQAGLTALADEASWFVERSVNLGIEGATVPFTVTAYDAAGNGTQLGFDLLLDTLAPTITLTSPPAPQIDFDDAFVLSGSAADRAGVSAMALEVTDPLGETGSYPVELDSPDGVTTGWRYQRAAAAFAIPGSYSYTILAADTFGNERRAGPYSLTVAAPGAAFLNDPAFVSASNDLWEGFVPGEPVYMRVQFDDADLPLGDVITVTVDPMPSWLSLTRLDERTVEISGTAPLTITQLTPPADLGEELEAGRPAASRLLQLAVGMTLTDSAGRQAYREWLYERTLTAPARIFLPFIGGPGGGQPGSKVYLPIAQR